MGLANCIKKFKCISALLILRGKKYYSKGVGSFASKMISTNIHSFCGASF
jgi:hypothetical protein